MGLLDKVYSGQDAMIVRSSNNNTTRTLVLQYVSSCSTVLNAKSAVQYNLKFIESCDVSRFCLVGGFERAAPDLSLLWWVWSGDKTRKYHIVFELSDLIHFCREFKFYHTISKWENILGNVRMTLE